MRKIEQGNSTVANRSGHTWRFVGAYNWLPSSGAALLKWTRMPHYGWWRVGSLLGGSCVLITPLISLLT